MTAKAPQGRPSASKRPAVPAGPGAPRTDKLLQQMIKEQRQTNYLLATLIEALSEEGVMHEDDEPTHYMDGTPVGYQPKPLASSPLGDE